MKTIITDIDRLGIGALTGFIVVLFTTTLNLVGRFINLLPEVMDLRHMADFLLDPATYPTGTLILGIFLHMITGVITGFAYALFVKSWTPGSGIVFMLIFWLFNMLVGMPLAGRGWFGLNDGNVMPVATFILHFIFGISMGWVARKKAQKLIPPPA